MGGRARRMGNVDKGTLVWNGRTFCNIALARLEKSFELVALSTGPSKRPQSPTAQFTDIEIKGGFVGPVGGLLAALDWADREGLSGIVTLPIDTPILPSDICERLCESGETSYAHYDGQPHWLHAAWPLSARTDIKRNILDAEIYSLHGLHKAVRSRAIEFEFEAVGAFKNINTKADLEQLSRVKAV